MGIRHGDPAQLLRTLLHEWAEVSARSEAERLDALLGEIACEFGAGSAAETVRVFHRSTRRSEPYYTANPWGNAWS